MSDQTSDQYHTIAAAAKSESKVRGSRFVAECLPVESTREAQAALAAIRKREHSATHHCFAYRIGIPTALDFKYSDDGEPTGTAGRPIYDAMCGRELTNTLIVVTRYFGGTKLGTGGLARAYGAAAAKVIETSGIVEQYVTDDMTIRVSYARYDGVARILNKYAVTSAKSEFSNEVRIVAKVRRSLRQDLTAAIVTVTGGHAQIE
ncbi:MAG TPA: YigZ family protein [Candidatus Deferrimicrobium sp.]|nr:YigZ family protein [Candidatus Deferrimicrobium sp.]